MEQIKELLEILKQTPEMALWAMALYFLFILMKLASWIYAAKKTLELFINRFFNFKTKNLELSKERIEIEKIQAENISATRILKKFNGYKISSLEESAIIDLIEATRENDGYNYIHESSIRKAIKAIENSKEKKK